MSVIWDFASTSASLTYSEGECAGEANYQYDAWSLTTPNAAEAAVLSSWSPGSCRPGFCQFHGTPKE